MKFLHTEVLDSLKQHVIERKELHRTRMAKGLPDAEYRALVGAHKECEHLIAVIDAMANDSEGKLDADDSETTGK